MENPENFGGQNWLLRLAARHASLRSERGRERPWLGLDTWLQTKLIVKEGSFVSQDRFANPSTVTEIWEIYT